MNFIAIVATSSILTATPIAVQSGGTQKSCRQEIVADCVKHLMTLRDLASGGAIRRDDAEQFCNKRTRGC
jgi:hypothetical protein